MMDAPRAVSRDAELDAALRAVATVILIDPAALPKPPHLARYEPPPVGTPLHRRQCPHCGYQWPEP